jgi:hypothetical protein
MACQLVSRCNKWQLENTLNRIFSYTSNTHPLSVTYDSEMSFNFRRKTNEGAASCKGQLCERPDITEENNDWTHRTQDKPLYILWSAAVLDAYYWQWKRN